MILEQAALYAGASDGRVTVTGFADTAGFTASGRRMAEVEALGRRRAERVAVALRRLGVPAGHLHTAWNGRPQPRDALAQPSLRRVEILVEP